MKVPAPAPGCWAGCCAGRVMPAGPPLAGWVLKGGAGGGAAMGGSEEEKGRGVPVLGPACCGTVG